MKLSDFDYQLPRELIAQYPLKERDLARMLVINRTKKSVEHRIFRDITDYLAKDDLLVLNDTKVLSCRLKGRRQTGGKVEALLLNQKEGLTFNALIRPSRVKLNEKIIFNNGVFSGKVMARNEITFLATDINTIYRYTEMPLPPYIKRNPEDLDREYYQTVYAKSDGAVAAPTGGLHFTEELLKKIESFGINTAYITLHVGYGTFHPVKSEDITKHKIESEYFRINEEAEGLIKKTRTKKGRIFAVGTTSCRALETYAEGIKEGMTNLFIYHGYEFKLVDCLLTNFHLPRTTLFILVCAFAGEKLIKKAYQEAIDKRYRFYSYGDAMLIL